ncbi:hypothetical protein P167DRAFT_491019 [Morchella conica CCBAS932]|uniref:Uncharacterized protein n=1 Tax=Morchella conica CCBAS932 TaxID=1392247 RepID=A0A3N4KMB0_9PEZI|nr:hypothetical protein P167DRAFT_491019 [Morchella conica CCBAS932]
MSYYENQAQTQASTWQSSRPNWEGRAGTTPVQTHFPRSHASDPSDLTARYTAQMKPEDPAAFGAQIDEVDRAVDNLVKSGKMFAPQRRDSLPVLSPRGFPEHETRMGNALPTRHYSVQDFDVMRSQSAANLQNFYATQRFQPRQTEAEQMMQAKRRLAAQRERDLRNYHQEQQYNRTLLAEISTYGKDRVMSPSAMTEDERRDLIARQHRALYAGGPDGHASEDGHLDENTVSRGSNIHSNGPSAPGSNAGGTRGPSPSSAFDPFGNQQNGNIDTTPVQTPATEQGQHAGQSAVASPTRSRTNSASSPSSKSASFSLFENAGAQAQSSRTSASSPGGSPPRAQRAPSTPVTSSGVAPIGTRPTQGQNPAVQNSKRSTTPLPSPLSYGFAQESDPFNNISKERSSPAPSNNSTPNGQGSDGLGWSKVWGPSNKSLGTVASVWG